MIDEELKQYLDEMSERNAAEFRQIREQTAAEFRQVREETARMREETAGQFQQMREETAGQFQQMREETAGQFRQLRDENAAAHAETRLYFDSTIDRFASKFDLLADGIKNIDEKLDREATDIRAEMRQGFADTHALIRFSHVQRTRRAKPKRGPAKSGRTKTKSRRAKTAARRVRH